MIGGPDGGPPPAEWRPFSAVLEEALYGPGVGFYERGGRAGRRGDFLTSPEVGPLFGAVLARALDAWWEGLGRPDPYLVDEHGAGPGTLARTVLVAAPECAPALRWTLVERSAAQRALHPPHLPHSGEVGERSVAPADRRWAEPAAGPLVASAAAPLPRPAHVAVANELLDNLPFDLFERTASGWDEVRVVGTVLSPSPSPSPAPPVDPGPIGGRGAVPGSPGGAPEEVLVTARGDDAARLDELAPGAAAGARVPLQRAAGEWLASTLDRLAPGGRLLVLDYAAATAELARRPWTEWLRTYAGHGRGGHPLEALGRQDVTVEVCLDQLARAVRPPDVDRDQATFLRAWGLDDLVEEGRSLWSAHRGAPDLAALRARSRATEAESLVDPDGLGAFRALEWVAPPT